jgi:hypothetical protein
MMSWKLVGLKINDVMSSELYTMLEIRVNVTHFGRLVNFNCPGEIKGLGASAEFGLSMISMLSSVDRHNNPPISTVRLIIPLESYTSQVQHVSLTYNALSYVMWSS